MDLYGNKNPSVPQKLVIVGAEAALIVVSYFILFGSLWTGFRAAGSSPSEPRNVALFACNVIVSLRFLLTLFVFAERSIPWEEALSIPIAFALYLVGFPLLGRPASVSFGAVEIVGLGLFAAGSFINTWSEHQRRLWKSRPENQGKLYTRGLFSWAIHPNYFGDLLWVTGYACLTHNPFAAFIPAGLFSLFYFYNVPKLDQHLSQHYGAAFSAYEQRTKRLIPFVL